MDVRFLHIVYHHLYARKAILINDTFSRTQHSLFKIHNQNGNTKKKFTYMGITEKANYIRIL